jgi:hypothetical protein
VLELDILSLLLVFWPEAKDPETSCGGFIMDWVMLEVAPV